MRFHDSLGEGRLNMLVVRKEKGDSLYMGYIGIISPLPPSNH